MKKLLLIICFLVAGFVSMATARTINEKLVQTFREIYPEAIQVTWKEYPETYVVYFSDGGIKSTIIFNKDGSFLRSTRYYVEDNLPYYLVAVTRDRYPSKKIFCVTEISSPSNIEYFLKLEDAKTWMTIKLDSEGNIKVLEKFNKG